MNLKAFLRRQPWTTKVVILTVILNVVFGVFFVIFLSPEKLTVDRVSNIAGTVLTVNATLFGLSAIAMGVFLTAMRSQTSEKLLKSSAMNFVGISFASFWLSLFCGFEALINPENAQWLTISISTLLVGAISGSIYIADALIEFLNKK
jgi:hypothetical protein